MLIGVCCLVMKIGAKMSDASSSFVISVDDVTISTGGNDNDKDDKSNDAKKRREPIRLHMQFLLAFGSGIIPDAIFAR